MRLGSLSDHVSSTSLKGCVSACQSWAELWQSGDWRDPPPGAEQYQVDAEHPSHSCISGQ